MNLKNARKILTIGVILIIIIATIEVINLRNKSNLVLAKYYPSGNMACQLSYKTYEMLMGGYSVLTHGNKQDSYSFPGFSFFEYVVPQCASWNNDNRPKLFSYKKNGGFSIQGNMVTNGYKTFFSGNGHSISLESFMHFNSDVGSQDNIKYMEIGPKNNVWLKQKSTLQDNWLYHGNEYDNYLGPSIFLNSSSGKIKLGEYSIGPTTDSKIVSSTLDVMYDHFKWNEYNKKNGLTLGNPSDFEFDCPSKTSTNNDCIIYITDKERRSIIKYNATSQKIENELGGFYWNWEPEALTIATTTCGTCNFTENEFKAHGGKYKTIYVSDSTKNRIIQTEIDGKNWAESFNNEYWDYYTSVFITGEEDFQYDNITTSTVNGIPNVSIVKKIVFKNKGFSPKTIWNVSMQTVKYNTVSHKNENGIIQQDDSIFGKHSYHFDGHSAFVTENDNDYSAIGDNVFVDFWFKADSDFYSTSTVFIDYMDNLEIEYNAGSHKLELNCYQTNSDESKKLVNIITSPEWYPDTNKWYYIGASRLYNNSDKTSDFYLYTDADNKNMQKMSAKNISDIKFNGNQLIIGTELHYDTIAKQFIPTYLFKGSMDNFRLIKGFSRNMLDERVIHPYYFNKPRGLAFNSQNNKIYITDSEANRIVIMDDDFKNWRILGKNSYGDDKYEFNHPTNIIINKDAVTGKNYFYIVDQGNQRIIKTDIVASSTNFRDLNNTKYGNNSWDSLNLKNYYTKKFNNSKDFYNKGNITHEIIYSDIATKTLNASLNPSCTNFNAININISKYIKNRIYGNREIYVYFDTKPISGNGNLFVSLTKHPGNSVNINHSNKDLNLIGTAITGGVKFKLPPRIDADWTGDIYLSFGSCDQYSLAISNIKITTAKKFIPSGISIVDNKLFITDIENATILEANDNPLSATNIIYGGKTPEEYYNKYVKKISNPSNKKIILENHRHQLKFISPVDINVIASQDSTGNKKYKYYILDNVSKTDISISRDDNEEISFFGTPQSRSMNVKLKDGKNNNSGGLTTPSIDTQGVLNIWQKWYNMDYHTSNNPKSGESANSEHKVWVGYDLGPAISHCDNHDTNNKETYALVGGNDISAGCNIPFTYQAVDNGETCHESWWKANEAIDVGTTYESCLLYNTGGNLLNPFTNTCNPHVGTPAVATVDCQQMATMRLNDSKLPPVPKSECVGQWDWGSQWPYCNYYTPNFTRKRVCDEYFPNCAPPGTAASHCGSIGCNGSAVVASCVNASASGNYWCGASFGSCSIAGGYSGTITKTPCNLCNENDDNETCYSGECNQVTCSYSGSCYPVNYDCHNETTCTASPTKNDPDPCAGFVPAKIAVSCSGGSTPPPSWTITEADDCCKKWHWECQASCQATPLDCAEGHAVRWRNDYKKVKITSKNNGNQYVFELRFFYDSNPTPFAMEKLIKDIEQEKYSPYGSSPKIYHKVKEMENDLLKSGIVISSYSTTYKTDKDYIDSIKENDITNIQLEEE